MKQTYIGDGVFCRFSGYDFVLYTSNGIEESNHIHLEPEHIYALMMFKNRVIYEEKES